MTVNVVVVGAGVIGSYLAYELTSRGAAVTLIDVGETCSGTSDASFAWVNSNDKWPERYGHLNHLGLMAHERALHTSIQGTWFHQIGRIELAETTAQVEQLEAKVATMTSLDYEATMLTSAQIRELEPALEMGTLRAGALCPREGWVDTTTMCASLVSRAQSLGATFVAFHTATDLDDTKIQATGPDGRMREFSADIVVLTAGNGTRELLARSGTAFPTLDPHALDDESGSSPAVGLISTTRPIASGLRHVVLSDSVSLRPARNGGVTLTDHPTGAQWDHTDPRVWTVPAELLIRAQALYPTLKPATTERVSLGSRVLPEDGLTIADWIGTDRRVYAVATHSGVTLAAHLATAVSDEVLDGTRDPSLEGFGLSRFADSGI